MNEVTEPVFEMVVSPWEDATTGQDSEKLENED